MLWEKWGYAAAAAMLIVLALVVAGCGDDDGGTSTTSTSTLTKAEFLKAGNAICVRGNEEIKANEDQFLKEHRDDDVRGAFENVLPVRKKELRLLRMMETPKEDAKHLQAMLAAMEEGIEHAEQHPHSLLLPRPQYAFSKAYVIGLEFGLVKCWLG